MAELVTDAENELNGVDEAGISAGQLYTQPSFMLLFTCWRKKTK